MLQFLGKMSFIVDDTGIYLNDHQQLTCKKNRSPSVTYRFPPRPGNILPEGRQKISSQCGSLQPSPAEHLPERCSIDCAISYPSLNPGPGFSPPSSISHVSLGCARMSRPRFSMIYGFADTERESKIQPARVFIYTQHPQMKSELTPPLPPPVFSGSPFSLSLSLHNHLSIPYIEASGKSYGHNPDHKKGKCLPRPQWVCRRHCEISQSGQTTTLQQNYVTLKIMFCGGLAAVMNVFQNFVTNPSTAQMTFIATLTKIWTAAQTLRVQRVLL